MSWLVDTDVLSYPAKEHRDPRIVAWLKQEHAVSYTSTVLIAQSTYWVRTKRRHQREALRQWLSDLVQTMKGRIYGFNVPIAYTWADLRYEFARIGKPMPIEDSYIAATTIRYRSYDRYGQ